jgi:hypothetical protein
MPGWKELEKILDGKVMGHVPPPLPATRLERLVRSGFEVIHMGEIDNTSLFRSMRSRSHGGEINIAPPIKPPDLTYEQLRKQVFFDLATTPLALGIEAIGLSGILAGLALSIPLLVIGSVTAMCGGAMLSLHRIVNFPTYIDKALEKLKGDKKKYQLDRLKYLRNLLILEGPRRSGRKDVEAEIAKLINSYDEFTTQVYQGKIKGSGGDLIHGADVVIDQVVTFTNRFLSIKDGKGSAEACRLLSDEIKTVVDRFDALLKTEDDIIGETSESLDKTLKQLEDNIDVARRVEERMKDMGLYAEQKGKENV